MMVVAVGGLLMYKLHVLGDENVQVRRMSVSMDRIAR